MTQRNYQFELTQPLGAARLATRLRSQVDCKVETTQTVERVFYDTFDWRVYVTGRVLEAHQDNGEAQSLHLRALNHTDGADTLLTCAAIRFVDDIPPSSVRRWLTPVVKMRALLPVAGVSSRITPIRVLNRNQKTVAYLNLEEHQVGRAQGKPLRYARLIPIKGYDKPLQRLAKFCLQELELQPAKTDLLIEALRILGREPGDYSSKRHSQLDPSMRTDSATKVVLQYLFEIMQANEAGVRADIDSEFLHDFRVAVRRTRSALGQIKDTFSSRSLHHFQTEFRWLQQVTGPPRDMDVYLLKFDGYQKLIDPALTDALAPLRDFLQSKKQSEYRMLIRTLDSARYKKLLDDWRQFLAQAEPEHADLKNAKRPIQDVACGRIWRLYRRVIKEGNVINDASPAERLHELRKTCKKLRYMMEFFQNLYAAGELKKLIRSVKQLQENLGNFNDLQVQTEALQKFSMNMHQAGRAQPQTLMAIGALVEELQRQKRVTRQAFQERFDRFARRAVDRRFRALFRSAKIGDQA